MCNFNVDFSKIFWGLCPSPPYWGGATAPLPRLHPLGAPALRASAPRSGPSVPLGTFGPYIPYKNPGYATDGHTITVWCRASIILLFPKSHEFHSLYREKRNYLPYLHECTGWLLLCICVRFARLQF